MRSCKIAIAPASSCRPSEKSKGLILKSAAGDSCRPETHQPGYWHQHRSGHLQLLQETPLHRCERRILPSPLTRPFCLGAQSEQRSGRSKNFRPANPGLRALPRPGSLPSALDGGHQGDVLIAPMLVRDHTGPTAQQRSILWNPAEAELFPSVPHWITASTRLEMPSFGGAFAED